MVLDADTVEGFVEEGGGLGLDFRGERGFESDQRLELGGVHSEERLPRGIDVEITAAGTERGDHLGGIVKEVAVAGFAFAQSMLGAAGGAQVYGDRNQAFDGA
jgi:hypothetical protein